MRDLIRKRVHYLYWNLDLNCARTMLICLGELLHFEISEQTLNAAIGLHGAGGYRAQCGLVEGALMFIGLYLSEKGGTSESISKVCYQFADQFMNQYRSLQCFELRPNGFSENDPPHICESLTCDAIDFTYRFIMEKKEFPMRTGNPPGEEV